MSTATTQAGAPPATPCIRVPNLNPSLDVRFELQAGEIVVTASVTFTASIGDQFPADLAGDPRLDRYSLESSEWLPSNAPDTETIIDAAIYGEPIEGLGNVDEYLRRCAETEINEACSFIRARRAAGDNGSAAAVSTGPDGSVFTPAVHHGRG